MTATTDGSVVTAMSVLLGNSAAALAVMERQGRRWLQRLPAAEHVLLGARCPACGQQLVLVSARRLSARDALPILHASSRCLHPAADASANATLASAAGKRARRRGGTAGLSPISPERPAPGR